MRDRRSLLKGLAALPLATAAGIAGAAASTSATSEDSLVTVEQMAAMPFEAFVHEPGDWTPPSVAEWTAHADPILITTTIAWRTLYKTKEELVGMVDQMWSTAEGEEAFGELIANLQRAQAYFELYTRILQMAEVRLMCASAVGCSGAEGGRA